MASRLKLKLPSSIQYLETIIDTAELFFQRNSINDVTIGELVASLTEAASNAIIHGNNNETMKYIYVDLDIEEDDVEVVVEDSNNDFEDFVAGSGEPVSPLSTSGRGIFIIKAYMDQVMLSRGRHGSRLMMKKIR